MNTDIRVWITRQIWNNKIYCSALSLDTGEITTVQSNSAPTFSWREKENKWRKLSTSYFKSEIDTEEKQMVLQVMSH